MDFQALKNEVINNPKNISDLSWSQTDAWIRDKLNTLGVSNETTVRASVSTSDIFVALVSDKTEFMALPQIDLVRLSLLSPVGNIAPADIQDILKEIFTVASYPNIREALSALATRSASRAEKIVGIEQNVSMVDVHKARRLP